MECWKDLAYSTYHHDIPQELLRWSHFPRQLSAKEPWWSRHIMGFFMQPIFYIEMIYSIQKSTFFVEGLLNKAALTTMVWLPNCFKLVGHAAQLPPTASLLVRSVLRSRDGLGRLLIIRIFLRPSLLILINISIRLHFALLLGFLELTIQHFEAMLGCKDFDTPAFLFLCLFVCLLHINYV